MMHEPLQRIGKVVEGTLPQTADREFFSITGCSAVGSTTRQNCIQEPPRFL
jgi:hypothetical protein